MDSLDSLKLQPSTSRKAPNFNHQNCSPGSVLEFGAWNLSGAWRLVFRAFAMACLLLWKTHANNARRRKRKFRVTHRLLPSWWTRKARLNSPGSAAAANSMTAQVLHRHRQVLRPWCGNGRHFIAHGMGEGDGLDVDRGPVNQRAFGPIGFETIGLLEA